MWRNRPRQGHRGINKCCKSVSAESLVVFTSRDDCGVLLSLIHNVIVPPLPFLNSFSCCIIECENSVLF